MVDLDGFLDIITMAMGSNCAGSNNVLSTHIVAVTRPHSSKKGHFATPVGCLLLVCS